MLQVPALRLARSLLAATFAGQWPREPNGGNSSDSSESTETTEGSGAITATHWGCMLRGISLRRIHR